MPLAARTHRRLEMARLSTVLAPSHTDTGGEGLDRSVDLVLRDRWAEHPGCVSGRVLVDQRESGFRGEPKYSVFVLKQTLGTHREKPFTNPSLVVPRNAG